MQKGKLAAIIGLALSATVNASEIPSNEELWQIIQQQQVQIKQLQEQLGQTSQQVQETKVQVAATADAMDTISVGSAKMAGWAEKTSIGGYGEHHFNHSIDGNDQVDAHRFVLFVGHQFDDSVRFFSEVELEHGFIEDESECDFTVPAGGFVNGASYECEGESSHGEVELEQAFVEWDFAKNHSLQVGQFLLPIGILNETHEPDTFFGTERNKVESEVIPSTWWETGAMVKGELLPGLSYNAAVHSGLAVPDSLRIRSGLQKSAEANAEDLAFTGRIKYTGIPGLELAASLQYQQDITQGSTDFSEGASATLFETHAVYRSDSFGFRALYAEWDIDGDDFKAMDADSLNGWYAEPSYKLTDKLGLFVRYSEYERADQLARDFETWDYGVNFWLHPRVVLKADYTDSVGRGDESDAFNLGLGWSF